MTSDNALNTVEGCEIAAMQLFLDISAHQGPDRAKEIFAALASPKYWRELNESIGLHILSEYRQDGLNLSEAAREIAEQNKELDPHGRLGPKGSTNPDAIRMWLARSLEKRTAKTRSRERRQMLEVLSKKRANKISKNVR